MYWDQRSQYIRPKSKKNSFRGNYMRKYGNCSSGLKNFADSRPSVSNFKSLSRSLEYFFLTVGQNNFGSKIPLLFSCLKMGFAVLTWYNIATGICFSIYTWWSQNQKVHLRKITGPFLRWFNKNFLESFEFFSSHFFLYKSLSKFLNRRHLWPN